MVTARVMNEHQHRRHWDARSHPPRAHVTGALTGVLRKNETLSVYIERERERIISRDESHQPIESRSGFHQDCKGFNLRRLLALKPHETSSSSSSSHIYTRTTNAYHFHCELLICHHALIDYQ
ncbi:hypothetical protein QQF64_015776 [Cirrhinus molitorella]|uniref:Uncharacterized protein n=1 Tax=Cirrhinus molitorella TaxID=172907 RepID=A0ABR3NWM5_9TELE